MEVLSFDPGETTGWAVQDERDDFPKGLIDFGQIEGIPELVKFLEGYKLRHQRPAHVVIESYLTYNVKANMGRELETIQVIGVLKGWCYRHSIPFTMQSSRDNTLIAKQTGMDPTKGKHQHTHWAYAANHGRWWLQTHGYAKDALQRSMNK